MLKSFNYSKNKEKELIFLLDFINKCRDYDFYFTHNNERQYVDTVYKLKQLLKESSNVYIEEEPDCCGIILVWKSIGGDKARYYIKLLASNNRVAQRLLTILLWNFNNRELFIKISKNSKFLLLFKNKMFQFAGGRGRQILMSKKIMNNYDTVAKDYEEE